MKIITCIVLVLFCCLAQASSDLKASKLMAVTMKKSRYSNVKFLSLNLDHSQGTSTLYYVTWKDGAKTCNGHSANNQVISMLKIAYILNMNVKNLWCDCNNGDIWQVEL